MGLPQTKGKKEAIWVIVDRLAKLAHFLVIKKTDSAKTLAQKYLDTVMKFHEVPISIVSDRDLKFTLILGTSVQTDSQNENSNLRGHAASVYIGL